MAMEFSTAQPAANAVPTAEPAPQRRNGHDHNGHEQGTQPQPTQVSGLSARTRLGKVNVVQALGWFSIGLGLVEVLAPRKLGRAIGVGERPVLLRLLGAREIANGVGLLSQRNVDKWTWARVAGDAMDLALLAAASRSRNARPERIALAAATVLGVSAVDYYSSRELSKATAQPVEPTSIKVSQAIAINANPAAVYAFWRKLENLALFMRHVQSVSATDGALSHWVARTPSGETLEWDAQIVADEAERRLSWRTVPAFQGLHEGTVTFEPGPPGRGTLLRVELEYQPPAGALGHQVARLLGKDPEQQIREDLRKFKQLIEAGEIATTQGQPSGKRSFLGRTTLGRLLS